MSTQAQASYFSGFSLKGRDIAAIGHFAFHASLSGLTVSQHLQIRTAEESAAHDGFWR
jgi:hypothetical protein